MQIAVCLLPERELAAELVVFTAAHATALGGTPLSLTANRPRLELCTGDLDEWALTPDVLADLAPAAPVATRFGELTVIDDRVVAPLGAPDRGVSRALLGLQALATVRLGLSLPHRWYPGIVLGTCPAGRLHPALRSDWTATMAGRDVTLSRIGVLRLDAQGQASTTVASQALA